MMRITIAPRHSAQKGMRASLSPSCTGCGWKSHAFPACLCISRSLAQKIRSRRRRAKATDWQDKAITTAWIDVGYFLKKGRRSPRQRTNMEILKEHL